MPIEGPLDARVPDVLEETGDCSVLANDNTRGSGRSGRAKHQKVEVSDSEEQNGGAKGPDEPDEIRESVANPLIGKGVNRDGGARLRRVRAVTGTKPEAQDGFHSEGE
jgi:hypothetical protein